MEINRSVMSDVIKKLNIKADKDYGQNFLVEPEIAKKIVDALLIEQLDDVLEIGPGLGSLTHFILLYSPKLDVVDIDKNMVDFLSTIYKNQKINIVLNDIRKVDVSKYTKIIGNLPYNITTEIITYLLLNASNCSKMVLMCQSETYAHFKDISGKEYGPVSVLLHLLGETKPICNVKPGSFIPVPKCSSTVFEITMNLNNNLKEAKEIFLFAKIMFLNRRKTIYNNLLNNLKDKEKTLQILNQCSIEPNTRPEQIMPYKYKELYIAIKK